MTNLELYNHQMQWFYWELDDQQINLVGGSTVSTIATISSGVTLQQEALLIGMK
jgi:hypothetical protein